MLTDYKDIIAFIVIGILATWARLLMAIDKITIFDFIRTAVTGALIGVCLGLGLVEDSTLTPWVKYSLFGIAVSLSEDIFIGILNVGKKLKENPQAFLRALWRK